MHDMTMSEMQMQAQVEQTHQYAQRAASTNED
jgi:hypothetical protein